MLPSQPIGWTGNLGYGVPSTPQYSQGQWYSPVVNAFSSVYRNLNKADAALRTAQLPGPLWNGSNLGPLNGVAQFGANLNAIGQQIGQGIGHGDQNYTSPFTQPQTTSFGQAEGLPNGSIPAAQANITGGADGLTPDQVAQKMVAAGYMLTNKPGVGEVWVPSGAGTQAYGGGANGTSQNTRPEWVDGAALAPGESVTDAYGNRYVGGTPAPDGTPQYAVNYANPAAANDKHGKYKWVSSVRKDSNGNWVRVNKQVLRKVYTRSFAKKQAIRQIENPQNPQANPVGEYNQLVNFRANFG